MSHSVRLVLLLSVLGLLAGCHTGQVVYRFLPGLAGPAPQSWLPAQIVPDSLGLVAPATAMLPSVPVSGWQQRQLLPDRPARRVALLPRSLAHFRIARALRQRAREHPAAHVRALPPQSRTILGVVLLAVGAALLLTALLTTVPASVLAIVVLLGLILLGAVGIGLMVGGLLVLVLPS